jgi:hypothetical protein
VGPCSSAGRSGATGSNGTAGRNRGSRCEEEEGKEERGADRWGRAIREREGERARAGLMGRRGEGVGLGGPSVGRGKKKKGKGCGLGC